jgi:hypothetical protein
MKGKLKWKNDKIIVVTENEEFDLDASQWQEVFDKNLLDTEVDFNPIVKLNEVEDKLEELSKQYNLYLDKHDTDKDIIYVLFRKANWDPYIDLIFTKNTNNWRIEVEQGTGITFDLLKVINEASLDDIVKSITEYLGKTNT